MSTKRVFKHIALLAVASLAIGGVSAVSAYAASAVPTLDTATATATTGTYRTVTLSAGSADKYYTITSSGVGSLLFPATVPAGTGLVAGPSELWFVGATPGASLFAGTESFTFSAYSNAAGTQTINIAGNSSAAISEVITWGAIPVLSVANSFVVANDSTDIAATTVGTTAGTLKVTGATADTALIAVGTSIGVLAGGATVGIYTNATSPVSITTDTISASVSGPGIITISKALYSGAPAVSGSVTLSGTSSQGRSVSTSTPASFAVVSIYSDGTVGSSTVTISDATVGVVLGTFSIVFHSTTIASLVAMTNTNVPLTVPAGFVPKATEGINSVSVVAGMAPVSVIAKDINGIVIPSSAGITVTSGTPSVAGVGALTYDSANGYSFVNINPLTVGSTVITFTDSATNKVVATTTVLVVSPVIAKLVASTDAAAYDPGTKVLYTLTATDAAGRQVADGTYTGLYSIAPTSNVGLQGALPGTGAITFIGGMSSSALYAPVTSTNVVIVGGTLSALAIVATTSATVATNSATFSVNSASTTNSDAAIAATAAKAATVAAISAGASADAATAAAKVAGVQATAALAAVAALNVRVTSVLAKIAAISVLIVRLIKKAKA